MKAPTADYSPISNAIKANTNAKQSSYMAADASNWESRYKIQQKSFELQGKSLDLQGKSLDLQEKSLGLRGQSIDNSDKWNNISFGLQLADAALNITSSMIGYKEKIQSERQTNENLNESMGWNLYSSESDTIIAKYGDKVYTEGLDENGNRTWIENPEMMQELSTMKQDIFGTEDDWSPEAWQRIQANSRIADNAIKKSIWQNYNQRLQEQNNTLMSTQYSGLMNAAIQSDDSPMVYFSYSDGNGGTITREVPQSIYNLARSMTTYTDGEQTNFLISAADDYINQKVSYDTNSFVTMLENGSFTSPAEVTASVQKAIDSANKITDTQTRDQTISSIKQTYSNAVTSYVDDIKGQIIDKGKNVYTGLDNLSKSIEAGGDLNSLFFDEDGKLLSYVNPNTLGSIRSSLTNTLTSIETANGKENPDEIKSFFDSINADTTITPLEYGTRVNAKMEEVYGPDWRSNSEANKVYETRVLEKVKEATKGNKALENAAVIAWQSMKLPSDVVSNVGKVASLKDPSQITDWTIAMSDMETRFYQAVINNPNLAVDSKAQIDFLTSLAEEYNAEWCGYLNTKTSTIGPYTDVDNEATNEINSELGSYSKYVVTNPNGSIDLYESRKLMPGGIGDDIAEDMLNIGKWINEGKGYPVEQSQGTLFVEKDSKGNYVASRIEWTLTDGPLKGQIIAYDMKTQYNASDVIFNPSGVREKRNSQIYFPYANQELNGSSNSEEKAHDTLATMQKVAVDSTDFNQTTLTEDGINAAVMSALEAGGPVVSTTIGKPTMAGTKYESVTADFTEESMSKGREEAKSILGNGGITVEQAFAQAESAEAVEGLKEEYLAYYDGLAEELSSTQVTPLAQNKKKVEQMKAEMLDQYRSSIAKYDREKNKPDSIKYEFDSNIDDSINGMPKETFAMDTVGIDTKKLDDRSYKSFLELFNQKTRQLWKDGEILQGYSQQELETFIANREQKLTLQRGKASSTLSSNNTTQTDWDAYGEHMNKRDQVSKSRNEEEYKDAYSGLKEIGYRVESVENYFKTKEQLNTWYSQLQKQSWYARQSKETKSQLKTVYDYLISKAK